VWVCGCDVGVGAIRSDVANAEKRTDLTEGWVCVCVCVWDGGGHPREREREKERERERERGKQ